MALSNLPFKPTKAEILNAAQKTVPDLIASNLRVLFCGINPDLYTAAVGHHFARPGNRFWPALHAAGFTDRLLSPFEEMHLLQKGYGITNLVERPTARAGELAPEELREGARRLQSKAERYKPRIVALVGLGAYRTAFSRPEAVPGLQQEKTAQATIWVLPSTSGINAHYRHPELVRLFEKLRKAAS